MKQHRIFSMLLVCAMVCSTCSYASDFTGNQNALNPKATNSILSEYALEIAKVEDAYGVIINQIDDNTSRLIQKQANLNLNNAGYQFQALMDSIILAFSEQALAQQPSLYSNDEVIANMTQTLVRSYGAISGNLTDYAASGVTKTKTVSVSLNADFKVDEYPLSGALTVQGSYSTTFTGPTDAATLYNGNKATRRYLCGILYGGILKTEWDICNRWTGAVISHHVTYTVDPSQKNVEAVSTLGSLLSNGALNIDSGDSSYRRTGYWSSSAQFETSLKNNPLGFMKGTN